MICLFKISKNKILLYVKNKLFHYSKSSPTQAGIFFQVCLAVDWRYLFTKS